MHNDKSVYHIKLHLPKHMSQNQWTTWGRNITFQVTLTLNAHQHVHTDASNTVTTCNSVTKCTTHAYIDANSVILYM